MTGAQGENVQFQEREIKGLQNALSLNASNTYVLESQLEPEECLQLCSMTTCEYLNLSLLPVVAEH